MTDQEARDERERLQRLIYTFETSDLGDNLAITTRDSYSLADAILAAGYRKHPEPEWEYAVQDAKGRIWWRATAGARPGDTAVRRTKAGPWEPIQTEEG